MRTAFPLSFALAAVLLSCVSARASVPSAIALSESRAQLDALKCESKSESCCMQWVHKAREVIYAEASAGSVPVVSLHRIDRWRTAERRPYCAIKQDVIAREKLAAQTSRTVGASGGTVAQ